MMIAQQENFMRKGLIFISAVKIVLITVMNTISGKTAEKNQRTVNRNNYDHNKQQNEWFLQCLLCGN